MPNIIKQLRPTINDTIGNGGFSPIIPGLIQTPNSDGSNGGTNSTPLGNIISDLFKKSLANDTGANGGGFQVGQYTNDDDDDSLTPLIAFEDNEIFDGLRRSKPFTPNIRDAISAFVGKEKGGKISGLVSGYAFGLPDTYFRRKNQPLNFSGDNNIEFYDEVFPQELTDEEFEHVLNLDEDYESFLGIHIGKKSKARAAARKEKRVARRDARKDARAARKQARVDRKNKRLEIKQYKAETKRIGAENGEPSGFDKILNTAKSVFGGGNNDDLSEPINTGEENYQDGNYDDGSGTDENGNLIQPTIKSNTTTQGFFGQNKTVAIIIILALVGAAIYFIKNNHGK
ncbi:hypothetical protein I5M32_11245 [Pedobacter sp. SD-b]|uniref:Uncharacterized protein n=1 Tax=Pedobacter segetis TaxID=2793069 RepID=A0ABS1BL82_9SPHI|nr:hypothetical protein [Pedobacter segetis]MBK0383532.1 hypothetical protein [Pedobacter segetis]